MNEHLDESEVSAVVLSALGISDDAARSRLSYRAFGHLANCEECRREVSERSAIIAGDSVGDDGELAPVSLDGYRIVPFSPSVPLVPPVESDADLALAAQTESVIERLPAFGASRAFRSADGRVELTVTENLRDDSCRVYLKARGDVDRTTLSFYLPPGVICAWPDRSYFEYPRFTFRAVDWTQAKLLDAVRPDEFAEPPDSE